MTRLTITTPLEPMQVTMDEATELTRIPRRTLDKMIAAGELKSKKIGSRRYVPMAEIRRLTSVDDEAGVNAG